MKTALKISIIIPAYNAEKELPDLWHSLTRQTYPQEEFETILVDNSSTDQTHKVANDLGFIVTSESEHQCSYAARNKGAEIAKGEWLVFLDADCLPSPDWLSEAIKELERQDSPIGSGNVEFIVSSNSSASALYDACTNLQVEESILSRHAVMTANLFVKSELYSSLGGFIPNVKSGGDLIFTYNAYLNTDKLSFLSKATVHHKPRQFRELMRKFYRTAKGKAMMNAINQPRPPSLRKPSHYLFPIKLLKKLKVMSIAVSPSKRFKMIAVHYIAFLASLVGTIASKVRPKQHAYTEQ